MTVLTIRNLFLYLLILVICNLMEEKEIHLFVLFMALCWTNVSHILKIRAFIQNAQTPLHSTSAVDSFLLSPHLKELLLVEGRGIGVFCCYYASSDSNDSSVWYTIVMVIQLEINKSPIVETRILVKALFSEANDQRGFFLFHKLNSTGHKSCPWTESKS